MIFTDWELKSKISSFLANASDLGTLDRKKKIDLQILLKERDGTDWKAVRETLKTNTGNFVARLGMRKQTAAKGAAGSIDNLLVLINSFIVIFAIAALVPVFLIYRDVTWIIPVALFCPAVHCVAFILARNQGVNPSLAKNMHLFAAVVSFIPLACLIDFAGCVLPSPALENNVLTAAVAMWVVHLIAVAILIRTENGFYCALVFPASVVTLWLILQKGDFTGAGCLLLMLAMCLYSLAGRTQGGESILSPHRLHRAAGYCLGVAFAILGLYLFFSPRLFPANVSAALLLYAAAMVMLPIAVRSENARLSGKRGKYGWMGLLVASGLFFGTVLAARGAFGVLGLPVMYGITPRMLLYGYLVVILAWSLLLLHEQFLAFIDFDENVFEFAAFLLLVCLVAGYAVLALHFAHFPAFLLAVGVFAATVKLQRQYAAVLPPHPDNQSPPAIEDDTSGTLESAPNGMD